MEKKDIKNKSVHSGHRQRMRDKAIEYGFESFKEHEIIEMLLFLGIPQRNTNPLAHELINKFGSFSAVFDAEYEDLVAVKGMTQTAAFAIKMIPNLCSRYLEDKNDMSKARISSSADAYKYFLPRYVDATNEVLSMMLLDNSGKILLVEKLSEGTINSAESQLRRVAELCMRYRATQVILCHNHPGGNTEVSREDFVATSMVQRLLNPLGVRLLDHIIIAKDTFVSMCEMDQFKTLFL